MAIVKKIVKKIIDSPVVRASVGIKPVIKGPGATDAANYALKKIKGAAKASVTQPVPQKIKDFARGAIQGGAVGAAGGAVIGLRDKARMQTSDGFLKRAAQKLNSGSTRSIGPSMLQKGSQKPFGAMNKRVRRMKYGVSKET